MIVREVWVVGGKGGDRASAELESKFEWQIQTPTGLAAAPSDRTLISCPSFILPRLASPVAFYRAQHAPRNVPQHTRPSDPAVRRRHSRPPPQSVLAPPERDPQTDASDLHPLLEHEPRYRQRPPPTRLHQQRHKVRLLLSLSRSSDSFGGGGRQRICLMLTPTLCIFPLCLVSGCLLSRSRHSLTEDRQYETRPSYQDQKRSTASLRRARSYTCSSSLPLLPFALSSPRLPSTPRLTPSFLFALLLELSFACCLLAESSSTAVPSPFSRAPGASQNRAFTSTLPKTNSKGSSTARGSRSTGGSERGRLSLLGRLRGDIWRAGRLWLRGLGGR